jgi:hypothetical protein
LSHYYYSNHVLVLVVVVVVVAAAVAAAVHMGPISDRAMDESVSVFFSNNKYVTNNQRIKVP